MKLIILGYFGGYPTDNKGTSSYLLESEGFNLLIDAGSASLISLEEKLDPLDLDAVLISHYHYDHIADIGVLQYTHKLKDRKPEQKGVLPIFGHAENQTMFDQLTMAEVSKGIAYKENQVLTIGPFQITFLKTKHPVTCFALRIVEKKTGKILVYTADSGYIDAFNHFAKEADVLLADTNLFNGSERHVAHMTAGEVGSIANKATVKKLILTHLPQTGDLNLLKKQAQEAYQKNDVLVAEKHMIVSI